ncbi:MAG: O-antigen ligase family protein [Robiginitomaculum sp.]|nr:O-antigen ligase family protein [Robiginitomaculum sp.]
METTHKFIEKNQSSEQADHQRNWVAKKNWLILVLVFLAYPLMSHAGGLGIAAILALGGVLGLIGWRPPHPRDIRKSVPAAIWAIMAVLLWAMISTLWSPYNSGDVLNNAAKLFIGVPLYLAFAVLVVGQSKYSGSSLQWLLISVTFLSSMAVLGDIVSDYGVTKLFDPLAPKESMNVKRGDMIQNLTHATSVLVLLFTPVGLMLWVKGAGGKLAAGGLLVLILAGAIAANMTSSMLALGLAVVFVFLASYWPKLMVRIAFFGGGISIFFAPLFGYIASQAGPEIRAQIPFSWEERVVNWSYMYEKVLQKPWFGHGFDAVRTFNDTHTIRGFEGRALVSLHPHNAGLHIWGELGLIGAVLVCLALFYAARKLTQQDVLTEVQLVALAGLTASAIIIAGFSYGVWQDWWWAVIIFSGAIIGFVKA